MLKDQMNFIKSRNGFISFIQSYKEHDLKEVFVFNELDYIEVAKSFFLPAVPFVKELRHICSKTILDQEYFEKSKNCPFQDKNQQKQFEEKKIRNKVRREEAIKKRNKKKRKIEKLKQNKNRSYHERKKAKERTIMNDFEEFNYEERLAKKLKKGLITKQKFEELVDRIDRKYENRLIN